MKAPGPAMDAFDRRNGLGRSESGSSAGLKRRVPSGHSADGRKRTAVDTPWRACSDSRSSDRPDHYGPRCRRVLTRAGPPGPSFRPDVRSSNRRGAPPRAGTHGLHEDVKTLAGGGEMPQDRVVALDPIEGTRARSRDAPTRNAEHPCGTWPTPTPTAQDRPLSVDNWRNRPGKRRAWENEGVPGSTIDPK